MSRKKPAAFKLRKPGSVDVEAFVTGSTGRPEARTPKRSSSQTSRRPDSSEERRRTTIYFSTEVRKRLAVYCAEKDAEMSEVVSEAVGKFLDRA